MDTDNDLPDTNDCADTRRTTTVRYVRLPEVLRRIPVSKSTLFYGIRSGRFPAPKHIGRIAVWSSQDIDDLIVAIDQGDL